MSTSTTSTLTVKQVAARWNVSIHQVLTHIRAGRLRAFDVSSHPGSGRPTWRIPLDAVIAFEEGQTAKTTTKPISRRPRKKRDADFVEYF